MIEYRLMFGADFAFMRDSTALVGVAELPFAESDTGYIYRLESERVWRPTEKPLRPSLVFREAMTEIVQAEAEGFCSDDHYLASVLEVSETYDVEHVRFPSDVEGIGKAFVRVRVLLGAHAIDLRGASDDLVRELKETTGKPLASGMVSIQHARRGSSHGDRARALVSAIYALENTSARALDAGQGITGGPRRMARRERVGSHGADGKWRELPPRRPERVGQPVPG